MSVIRCIFRGPFRALSLAILATALAISASAGSAWAAPYSSIVVDVKTGEVLQSTNADSLRYPASLTKIMTLYIVFEELHAGRLERSTPMRVSQHAASQPPSKLGLRVGSTITVKDAILALVTKSANDVAATIAEHIGGSEAGFAKRMTETAHALGMSRTTFRNASGLPNAEQVTTARDMATLGRAIQDRFPDEYKVFSTRSFRYRGRNYGNHNRLLGRVRGVDGIKTGYTRASGYNLVTSVRDNNRQIVAVVIGGRTGRERNTRMTRLVSTYLPRASRGPRLAPLLMARPRLNVPAPVPHPRSAGVAVASAAPVIAVPASRPALVTAAAIAVPAPVPAARVQESASTNSTPPYLGPGSAAVAPLPTHGWTIQIGALDVQRDAVALLDRAQRSTGSVLAHAAPYTQPVDKNGTTLWRARFGGFESKESAREACNALSRRDFACLAVRP